MCRCRAIVVLYVVLVTGVIADTDTQGGYGLRYSQRPREARGETTESQRFTPSQEVEEAQQEIAPQVASTPRQRQHPRISPQVQDDTQEDSNVDASSYRTVVLHDTQAHQRYQNVQKKPTKPRQKVRQVHRETQNYKSFKNPKLADPPPQTSNVLATPAPDQFVHAVHPSIMQNLLKQQPQTFDVPQEKETDNYEQQINWNNQEQPQNVGMNGFHSNYVPQGNAGQQDSHDIAKRPIYVPNRVSVHSPSSDTSFNVGYSIGFGSGFAQHPKMGIVQPPVNTRHGKQLALPVSYQNVPVNVHVNGKNTVWKNMGSGVEMSHEVGLGSKVEYQNIGSSDGNDRHVYSTGSVINQPIFFREGFDQNFNTLSTSGRNNFDHNHALQQSNSFDFSNAIDPMANNQYSTEQKTNQLFSHVQPSFAESFSKQPVPSFTESFEKNAHSAYSDTFPKQTKASYVRGQPNHKSPKVESSQYTHTILNTNNYPINEGKYERPKHEKSPYHSSLQSAVRIPNSINLLTKPKTDFTKSDPGGAKSSYSFKTFSNTGQNVNDENFGNNFGFQNTPVLQPMYNPGKMPPPGMVQAFLVPVNSQNPGLSYPVGMPLLSNGYSPYFGHPVGMVRIPDSTGVNVPQKEEFESSPYNVNSNSEQSHQSYLKSPVKLVQTHYGARHQKEEATDPQIHLTRPNSHPRIGDVDRSPKFNRVYSADSTDHAPFRSQVSSSNTDFESFFDDPSFKEPTQSYSTLKESNMNMHHPITHHPRPYRTKKLVIVKRA
ncbi:uncharacterized protein LOC128987269 [Macrosteles quadrilineatus]|uniref:uncharacterized protein LOC128987269 n=1 Tax=Macrosteles quadrilineatus TaxID=74068 RepID=UPI0023E1957A|nr:uncharacterized protein LOC128987269 [Macrosteles quadrilineatus]